MARITTTQGACPVCAAHVPRTVHTLGAIQREVFHCLEHGRLEYGAADIPLGALYALDGLAIGAAPLTH
jgi:hypothetical protein